MRNGMIKVKSHFRLRHITRVSLFFILLFSFFIFTGCYTYHYVPEGEHVLYHNEYDIHMADSSEVTPEVKAAVHNLKNYALQRPNSKFLGIKPLRVSMSIYGIANPKDNSFIGKYFRSLGQAPVVYDIDKASRTASQLRQLMQSKGCFNSTVTFDTLKLSKQNITIGYHILASPRYTIDEVVYRTDNPDVARLLQQWRPEAKIQEGQPYDQDNVAAERARIVNNLRESGYYHATNDLVRFVVDTTYSSNQLSIDVFVDSRDLRVYHINNIYIYPNPGAQGIADTLIHTYTTPRRSVDFQFVYTEPMRLRPQTISRAMMLFPGMTYRPRYISNTYNSLLSLRNFKYINIDFSESPSSTDSLPLVDAHVRLIEAIQQRLSLSFELTNASPFGSSDSTKYKPSNFFLGGNLGVETAIEYKHKNLFGGAEMLRVKGSMLLELPKITLGSASGHLHDDFSAFETNLDMALDMPVFLIPFSSKLVWQRIKPHTLFTIGGSYQYRYYYERILANTSFGYNWTHSIRASNQVLPIELTFVRLFNLDYDYLLRFTTSDNIVRFLYQYSDHFIMDARYDYTFSNQKYGLRQNFSACHLSVETAGNLLNLLSNLTNGEVDSNNVRRIFGVPYSQYVRLTGEYTRYLYHGKRNTFVARCLLGIGIPYGNSYGMSMPYEKSFFGGGTTTMRAWHLRHLGPGGFKPDAEFDYERVGDLQFIVNLEERFPIYSIVEGALFADMGNIWVVYPGSNLYPNGEFKWNKFYKEIAVGVGLGFRVNVSIATLRVDFGIPLYDPGFDIAERWRLPHWRLNQIVTNFGINYPF